MDSLFDNLNLGDSLNNFKKTTGDAMNTVKSSILTPISAVQEKYKDGVALVKSTDSKLQSVISGYKSAAVSQLDGIIGALSGGLLNTSDLTKMVRVGPDGVSFSTDDLIRDVGDKVGLDMRGGGGFMQSFANTLNNQFSTITGGYFGDMVTADGGKFRISNNWRGQGGSAVLDMLRRYASVDDLIDLSVTNSFYNTLLYSSAQYGMADSYASILSKYTIPADGKKALVDAVQYMLANGDVDSLTEVIKLLDTSGIMAVNAKYPQFVETLLSKFSFAANTTSDQYAAIRTDLLTVLVKFAGPDWYYRNTEFGKAYNLALSTQISADVQTLFLEQEELMPMMLTSGMFQDDSAVSVLKNQYPETPILGTA